MEIKRQIGENEEQFLWRIGFAKDNGLVDLNWDEIANLMNKEFRDEGDSWTEAAYRKPYQQAKRFFDANVFRTFDDKEYIEELRDAKAKLRIEKQKLFDERAAYTKQLREQGRRESLYDIVKRAIDEYKPIRFEQTQNNIETDNDNDFIIHLTDIHYGVDIDSIFNFCNSNVLKTRLQNFLNEIKDLAQLYKPENAYLILGGDMIDGIIHLNSRIEAKENVVDQIIGVSELLSNFIFELSKLFKQVEVHSTAGNHARSMSNKDHVPHGENFDLIVHYICKKDLKNIENVKFVDNELDYDIAIFNVRGHTVYASHGDKDTVSNVVYNMTKFARKAKKDLPDIIYLGHRHTNGMTTIDDVKIIESGCVDGMDTYAIEKRLVGTPEQTVAVVTENKKIKALCDIQVG